MKKVSKKFLAAVSLLLTLMLFVALAAQPALASEEKPLRIFFTNAFYNSVYCAALNEGMRRLADELGVELQMVDGEANAMKQLDQIKTAITQGFDGIIYYPADSASTVPVVKELAASGIPFINMNLGVDDSVKDLLPSHVGGNYMIAGSICGQMGDEILGEEGGNIVIIEGSGGTDAQMQYTQGFLDIVGKNPNNQVLATQQADWDPAKAMKIMEDYLTQFGDKIDLIYCHDGGMFTGAASALEAAGLLGKIPVICNGSNFAVLDAIRAGTLYGSSSQSPWDEGRKGLNTIIKLINGEPVDKWVVVDHDPITLANVDEIEGF